jgi:exopolysaccharide biosynthesis protein
VKGEIVIMVVDGRQVESRGAYLKELALLMSQFNCFEAINLDGGGSSALIVDGKLVNSPIGLNSQREVMSTIAILSED